MAATPDASDLRPALDSVDIDRYVDRLGTDPRGAPLDLATLRCVHLAHLERIPFENLDIVFGDGAVHDRAGALAKIVGDGSGSARGGWCFELNGALSLLLEALGYDVRLLGAAVLHDGPTQVIEHLLLEVRSPMLAPHLVDVGFGDSFDVPLALNTAGPQDGGSGTFELIGSPQGTTLARLDDGVPTALLRFKRVAHEFDDFAAIAGAMQSDPARKWSTHPFATRRLADDEQDIEPGAGDERLPVGAGRVTLTRDRLKITRGGQVHERAVERTHWASVLDEWFSITLPEPGRDEWPTEQPSGGVAPAAQHDGGDPHHR